MESAYLFHDSDCSEIKQKLIGFIYELHGKRLELADCKTKHQESLLRIKNLELDLDRERNKSAETKIQLEVAIKASERCETKRVTLREQVAVQVISAEAAYKERDYLKEQNRNLHGEVSTLKSDLEHSQNQVRELLSSVDNFKEKMARNTTALEALDKQVNKLDQDSNTLNSMLERTNEFSSKVATQISVQNASLRDAIDEKEQLKKQLLCVQGLLNVETSKAKMIDETSRNIETLDYTKQQIKLIEDEFSNKLKTKEIELNNLNSALNVSLESFKYLQSEHSKLKSLFTELEEELHSERSASKPSTVDVALDTSFIDYNLNVSDNKLNATSVSMDHSQ